MGCYGGRRPVFLCLSRKLFLSRIAIPDTHLVTDTLMRHVRALRTQVLEVGLLRGGQSMRCASSWRRLDVWVRPLGRAGDGRRTHSGVGQGLSVVPLHARYELRTGGEGRIGGGEAGKKQQNVG